LEELYAVLLIRDVYPGSESRIRILIFYPSRIPDPGVKKAPDPGADPQHRLYVLSEERRIVLKVIMEARALSSWYFLIKIFSTEINFIFFIENSGLNPQ
jgi:hypothetical protein